MQVGRGRRFTPSEDDCHSTLKVDVVVIDSLARTPYSEIGKTFTTATNRVRATPKIPRRRRIPLPQPQLSTGGKKFSVLTYNLLADLYSNVRSSPLTSNLPTFLPSLGVSDMMHSHSSTKVDARLQPASRAVQQSAPWKLQSAHASHRSAWNDKIECYAL